ncbi:tail fiber domain-containing protein [Algibacter sp. Ld11]|uniref:tail fiber domain-containing protein n=1 Tax=Algibacter sp. Ld11 TaxID=649150 RepID=UPI003866510F
MFTKKPKTHTVIKRLLMLCFVTITQLVNAQQGINYKAILKDTDGNVLSNTYMTVQFSIHQNTETGAVVYQEDHNYTTDANGLVILSIGTDITPSIGDFNSIAWGKYAHFLQTSLTYSGGTINFDATEFMSVPYAKHAEIAAVAENVFSGDYNDLINQPNTIPTGLESIDEGNGAGWRLIGSNPENFGSIGYSAIDLSISVENSELYGATGYASFAMGVYTEASGQYSTGMGLYAKALGDWSTATGSGTTASGQYSTAMGSGTTASGDFSTAMGYSSVASGYSSTAMGRGTTASGDFSTAMGIGTTASGDLSTAMGSRTEAPSFAEMAIGRYNTTYEPTGVTSWDENDRLFVVGNGTLDTNRNDAFTVLKNGKTGINTSSPQSLLEVAHQDGGPTPSNLTNAISIKNLNSDKSWQFHVNNLGALVLYRNGIYTSYFHETSGAYVTVSDRRLKKNITGLENGTLNKVMQLNPVSYLMKEQKDTKRNLGLISQEVQEVFPSITHYVEAQDILSLSYIELIPILIKALQEQQGIIDTQIEKNLIQDKSITAQNEIIKTLVARLDFIESKSSN